MPTVVVNMLSQYVCTRARKTSFEATHGVIQAEVGLTIRHWYFFRLSSAVTQGQGLKKTRGYRTLGVISCGY